MYDHLPFLWLN